MEYKGKKINKVDIQLPNKQGEEIKTVLEIKNTKIIKVKKPASKKRKTSSVKLILGEKFSKKLGIRS